MAGGKIYNSNRILHALLKKSCKTGGCLLKNSDQDHRIRGVGGCCLTLSEPSKNPNSTNYPTQVKKRNPGCWLGAGRGAAGQPAGSSSDLNLLCLRNVRTYLR